MKDVLMTIAQHVTIHDMVMSMLAPILIGAIVALALQGRSVNPELLTLGGTVVGYYFGAGSRRDAVESARQAGAAAYTQQAQQKANGS